ncbi:endonuclease VII domain-containing protein [Streptomyces sp. NPDC005970]|uniref:endonuclease VII domain-containing protein n=1 Tax=Streptomyces sp. NPDC005970 TaxID=3156723 RepID=UPI003407820F
MGRTFPMSGAVQEDHKYCHGCGKVRPRSEWHRKESSPDGLASRCRSCRAVDNRVGHLKRQYGLTPEELDLFVAAQQGVCCICLAAPPAHVDHCHEKGKVRGVLCFSCNAALGQFKDRPDVIRRAATYLEGNAWKPTLVAPGVYQLPS